MISEKMYKLGSNRSVIRELFEFGKKRKAEIGDDNVYDFSIGNPSVPSPKIIQDTLIKILSEQEPTAIHGYTSAQGDPSVRKAIADDLNARYETQFTADNFYMTCGAAASLTISIRAVITDAADEFITFAPFFTEYRVFVESQGGKLVVVPPKEPDFQIDLKQFEESITPKTAAVIINSPNNPSGVIYSEETIKGLAAILEAKEKEYHREIYLISDEPYREINYGKVPPFVTKYYNNSIICYSYSKSLSLPGERIGYVLVPNQMKDWQKVYAAICGSGRSLGFICAPSLFQKLIAQTAGLTSDLSIYAKNRDLLYKGLTSLGFSCVYPDGAFYLFMKTKESDTAAFCEKAKKYDLLLVPADDFGCPGYVRIAYCVSTAMIERSMAAFAKLADEYK
ncbi:MAG: pyridoxal phosphate-dependent aminotransferase [Succinivibrionaceae bacterium]|nr:pyridoxal phosphate-dependent aminotransferase [Succinivibrionaceae bacterium]